MNDRIIKLSSQKTIVGSDIRINHIFNFSLLPFNLPLVYKLIVIPLICLMACNSKTPEDPIWHINPQSNGRELMEQLNSDIHEPRYFSYKKRIEWKDNSNRAIINCYLTQPNFEDNHLRQLRYTLSVDQINNKSWQFNKAFYEFFKSQFIHSFGDPANKTEQGNKILLQWKLKNNMMLSLDISKEFNSYFVEYKR